MPSLIDIEEKRVIIGASSIATVVGLLLSFFIIAPLAQGSTDNNCVDIDCLKEKLNRICKEGSAPPYLDCNNILRYIDGGEVMRCAKGYLAA